MKGIVFTEFVALVEETWGLKCVDDLIGIVNPESGGAYTSVGTYKYAELVSYITALSERTGIDASTLILTFGKYLAKAFMKQYPGYFRDAGDLFSLLKSIDNHIHIEVQKLSPNAMLPSITYEEQDENTLILHYQSQRQLADLAHGLILSCAEFYATEIDIERISISSIPITKERFTIRKIG